MLKQKPIVLIGLMGCGKTTIGKWVAKRSGWKWLDVDHLIEKKAGATISEIFEQKGELEFRKMEREMIEEVMGKKEKVISIGGGAFQDETNRKTFLEKGVVFYLKASVECLYERVRRDASRPLLQNEDPIGTLQKLSEKREPFYNQAHFTINVERRTPDQIAREIWKRYSELEK